MSQLNSIISSYSTNPAMLSSLLTAGTQINGPAPNAGSFQPMPSFVNQHPPSQAFNAIANQAQAPALDNALVDNAIRFLTQDAASSHASNWQMLRQAVEPHVPINPSNQYRASQQITDATGTTTGTTTDTSASYQGRNDYTQHDFEPDNKGRKRRRSPSPP
jgi:hypothetical protein